MKMWEEEGGFLEENGKGYVLTKRTKKEKVME